jgi:MFS transporter, OFA family, oxalate/formate antiporter
MKKYTTVFASFVIMLCTGSVYAWSIIASELMCCYGFTAFQSQMIFAAIIAVFPVTMIFVGRIANHVKYRTLGYISGIFFFAGYFIAGQSQGNFSVILLGIGVLAGIATGFGYWLGLTAPVQWFPHKKGLITGISAAGFGLGAIFMTAITERILGSGNDIMQVLKFIGLTYGALIFLLATLVHHAPEPEHDEKAERMQSSELIHTPIFRKLFIGIFLGTFAGLMIIGSLKIIGDQNGISTQHLVFSISLYAIANFLGRLVWGYCSDHIGASISIFLALILQSIALILLNIIPLNSASFLILVFFIGFGFGGNFVLFAKETAELFGVKNLGLIYPFVFLGYAIAGIAGPMSGGHLFDMTGSYFYAIILASVMSLAGALVFLREYIQSHKKKN